MKVRSVGPRRWQVAQEGQKRAQIKKRSNLTGHEQGLEERCRRNSLGIFALLLQHGQPHPEDGLVVEVGSGAHGLIWRWPAKRRMAIDPLALFFRQHFDFLQADGPMIVNAQGEGLPLASKSAALVISDNVLDHVDDPRRFLTEIARVLETGGTLYLTVDHQHQIWAMIGRLYDLLVSIGITLSVRKFPNHPHQFSRSQVERLVESTGFEIVWQDEVHLGYRPKRRLRSPVEFLRSYFYRDRRLYFVARRARNDRQID